LDIGVVLSARCFSKENARWRAIPPFAGTSEGRRKLTTQYCLKARRMPIISSPDRTLEANRG
nr:hypothetical protein [Gammaproteobacteria bacterium]